MNKQTKTTLTVLISLIIAGFLVFWVARSMDFEKFKTSLKNANLIYIGISFIIGLLAYWFRSQRWRLLLKPIGYTISAKNAFAAVCINYLMNLAIPRSGEIARCGAVFKTDDIPIDNSFGTVVIERVIDFICLFIVIGLTLIFKYDLILKLIDDALATREGTETSYTKFYIFGFILLLGLILFGLFRKKIKASQFYAKVKDFLKGLKEGILSISKLKNRGLFITYTVLIWVAYYLMTYIVCFSFQESSHLGFGDGLFLLVAGGIGMIIPASGGIGSYHAAMSLAFGALGLSEDLGIAYGFLMHTPQTVLAMIVGGVGIFIVSRAQKSKKKSFNQ